MAALCLFAGAAHAGCVSPAGNERDMIYNNDYHVLQFCNGSMWIGVGPVAGGTFRAPADGGYFVMSKTLWKGNLGGIAGADAKCRTDLTTNTGWKGYADANARNILTAAKVHAFLCDDSACNNLSANTIYSFADANDSSHGGARFATDGSGNGPGNGADWSRTGYFGSAYTYWAGGRGSTQYLWGTNVWSTGQSCNGGWGNATGSYNGNIGIAGSSGDVGIPYCGQFGGWCTYASGTACNTSLHLICYVNP